MATVPMRNCTRSISTVSSTLGAGVDSQLAAAHAFSTTSWMASDLPRSATDRGETCGNTHPEGRGRRKVRLVCVNSRRRLRELTQTKRSPGTGQPQNRARQEPTRQEPMSQQSKRTRPMAGFFCEPGRDSHENDVSTHHNVPLKGLESRRVDAIGYSRLSIRTLSSRRPRE